MAIEVLVHLTSVMSLQTCHSSFLVTENCDNWQLHQYCENGLQMENKSQEILHHLGTQKDEIDHIAVLHCPPSIITSNKRRSVDSKLLRGPRNVGYYHIFEQ